MNLKKKVTLHLDAILVLGLLLVLSITGSAYLLVEVQKLSKQNMNLEMQMLANELNLSSQQQYIRKLQDECGLESGQTKLGD